MLIFEDVIGKVCVCFYEDDVHASYELLHGCICPVLFFKFFFGEDRTPPLPPYDWLVLSASRVHLNAKKKKVHFIKMKCYKSDA